MPTFRLARVLVVSGVLATVGMSAACSSTPDAVTAGTSLPGTTQAPTRADAASSGGTKATCDPTALVPVIQQKYGAAGVDHLVCLVPNAVVTVKTGGDDTIAFLVQRDGAWVVAVDGPTGDGEKLIPADFPQSILRSWREKRTPPPPTEPRAARPTTTERPLADGESIECTGEGGDVKCVTVTTKPTTTRPPTTAPPVTTAPPPVTTPAPPTTFSQFCLENPLDPTCSGGQ